MMLKQPTKKGQKFFMLPEKEEEFEETVKRLFCASKIQVKSGNESQH